MNKVWVLGRLAADPELKTLGDRGVTKASFSVVTNRAYKNRDGEKVEEATFIPCEAWNGRAERIGEFFSKGRRISLEGRLQQDTWTDQETGKKRSKLFLRVDNFEFVDSSPEQSEPKAEAPPPADEAKAGTDTEKPAPPEDDIPF
jgi:single-strand DNA-binding protein